MSLDLNLVQPYYKILSPYYKHFTPLRFFNKQTRSDNYYDCAIRYVFSNLKPQFAAKINQMDINDVVTQFSKNYSEFTQQDYIAFLKIHKLYENNLYRLSNLTERDFIESDYLKNEVKDLFFGSFDNEQVNKKKIKKMLIYNETSLNAWKSHNNNIDPPDIIKPHIQILIERYLEKLWKDENKPDRVLEREDILSDTLDFDFKLSTGHTGFDKYWVEALKAKRKLLNKTGQSYRIHQHFDNLIKQRIYVQNKFADILANGLARYTKTDQSKNMIDAVNDYFFPPVLLESVKFESTDSSIFTFTNKVQYSDNETEVWKMYLLYTTTLFKNQKSVRTALLNLKTRIDEFLKYLDIEKEIDSGQIAIELLLLKSGVRIDNYLADEAYLNYETDAFSENTKYELFVTKMARDANPYLVQTWG